MKKTMLAIIAGVLLIAGTRVHALSMDVLTNFAGTSQPTGRFYTPLMADMSLITGFAGKAYTGPNTSGSTVDALVGVKATLPIVGMIDTYTVWSFTNQEGSSLRWIVFAKSWTTKLTDKVNVGLYLPLIKFATEGSKEIRIFSDIQPQVGMNVDLF